MIGDFTHTPDFGNEILAPVSGKAAKQLGPCWSLHAGSLWGKVLKDNRVLSHYSNHLGGVRIKRSGVEVQVSKCSLEAIYSFIRIL